MRRLAGLGLLLAACAGPAHAPRATVPTAVAPPAAASPDLDPWALPLGPGERVAVGDAGPATVRLDLDGDGVEELVAYVIRPRGDEVDPRGPGWVAVFRRRPDGRLGLAERSGDVGAGAAAYRSVVALRREGEAEVVFRDQRMRSAVELTLGEDAATGGLVVRRLFVEDHGGAGFDATEEHLDLVRGLRSRRALQEAPDGEGAVWIALPDEPVTPGPIPLASVDRDALD